MDIYEFCQRFNLGDTVLHNALFLMSELKKNVAFQHYSDKLKTIWCICRSAYLLDFIVDIQHALAWLDINEKFFNNFLKILQHNDMDSEVTSVSNISICILNRLECTNFKIRSSIVQTTMDFFKNFDFHVKNLTICTYIKIVFNPCNVKEIGIIIKQIQLFIDISRKSILNCYSKCELWT